MYYPRERREIFFGGGRVWIKKWSKFQYLLDTGEEKGGGCYDEPENEALVDGSYRDLAENWVW